MDELKNIDFKSLERDPEYFKKVLTQYDDNIVTNKEVYIMFPAKFVDRDLSSLGNICNIIGLIAIMDIEANKYSILTVPSRLETMPSEIGNIVVDGEGYYVLKYDADSEIISSRKLIKESDFIFDMFELFLVKGKVPWYYGYNDVVKIFNNIKKYTGGKAAENQLAIELLVSIIARYDIDWSIEYRNVIESLKDLKEVPLAWVGLENIFYSFRSTLSKLAGAYMKKGIVSAIINPEKEISDLEHVLRE